MDGLVFIAGITGLRYRDDGRIQDLSAPRDVALLVQIAVKQRLDHPRLYQRLAIEPDRLRIWHAVLQT